MNNDKYFDRFTAIPQEFIINKSKEKIETEKSQFNEDGFVFKVKINKKVSINKGELAKVNGSFIPRSKNQKFEDDSVKELDNWCKVESDKLMSEIEKFYSY